MPQFDPTHFPTQLVWLAITFALLYIAMARVALPRIAQVLEIRQDRIESDLEKAEKLKREAETALAAYETTMAEARTKAQGVLRETSRRLAAEAVTRQSELARRMAEQTKAAEDRIGEARERAIANIRTVAAEVAGIATTKLIGKKVAEDEIGAAVDAVLSERG